VSYQENRKNGLRGQGPKLRPRFTPKGEKVLLDEGTNDERELPNAEGNYFMGKTRGNRSAYHRKTVDRSFTRASGEKAKHKLNKSRGQVEQLQNAGRPRVSNYVRHEISKANRAVKKGKVDA